MINIINWVQTNWIALLGIYGALVTIASYVVRLTPTLADDVWLKKVLKFIGKWIAVNNSISQKEQTKVNTTHK